MNSIDLGTIQELNALLNDLDTHFEQLKQLAAEAPDQIGEHCDNWPYQVKVEGEVLRMTGALGKILPMVGGLSITVG